MVKEIVEIWIKNFLEEHNATELNDIPKEVIHNEIKETYDNIENCELFGDDLGIICNERYIKELNNFVR